mgnify:CR=1 FL=1
MYFCNGQGYPCPLPRNGAAIHSVSMLLGILVQNRGSQLIGGTKRMKKSRVLALGLTAALSVSLLAGCGTTVVGGRPRPHPRRPKPPPPARRRPLPPSPAVSPSRPAWPFSPLCPAVRTLPPTPTAWHRRTSPWWPSQWAMTGSFTTALSTPSSPSSILTPLARFSPTSPSRSPPKTSWAPTMVWGRSSSIGRGVERAGPVPGGLCGWQDHP